MPIKLKKPVISVETLQKQPAPLVIKAPADLKAWLAERAKTNCRSMQNEALMILKNAYTASEQIQQKVTAAQTAQAARVINSN